MKLTLSQSGAHHLINTSLVLLPIQEEILGDPVHYSSHSHRTPHCWEIPYPHPPSPTRAAYHLVTYPFRVDNPNLFGECP